MVKNGHSPNGTQRWLCNSCKKSFRFEYKNQASKPGVKDQIIELTLTSSGVRDISRILKIHRDTVTSSLKKTPEVNSYFLTKEQRQTLKIEIKWSSEMDEFWSFVGNKSNQRWTGYAIDKDSGCVLT